MAQRKYRLENACPRCFHETEDTTHVLQCPHSSAQDEWDRLLQILVKWMRENKTHPDIRIALFHVLWQYRQPTVQNKDTYLPSNRLEIEPAVRQCLKAQVKL